MKIGSVRNVNLERRHLSPTDRAKVGVELFPAFPDLGVRHGLYVTLKDGSAVQIMVEDIRDSAHP